MIYTLHHSKGSLLVSADDREQVVRWSEHQLGTRAGFVSITEGCCTDAVPAVEKDGTGISAMEAEDHRSIMSILANFAQDVREEHGSSRCHEDTAAKMTWRIKEPTWH